MIMCEWHQLMYIAIITPSKPTTCTSRFSLHITDRLATKPQMSIFRSNNTTKNYTYLSSIFNPNNLFKNEKSTFTANLKVRPWYLTGRFPLNASRGLYFSHFIRPSLEYLTLPRSHPKRILGNSAIPFHSFFYKCRATQYYQQNFESIEYFTTPNSPKLPW